MTRAKPLPPDQRRASLIEATRQLILEHGPYVTTRQVAKAAGVAKGSATPHTVKVGSITEAQAREIAETKMPDLNANDLDAATKIVAGTARSMGITVE